MKTPIPAIWRIDVEPDEFENEVGEGPWTGFLATVELAEELRKRLADRSGHPVRPAWFVRFDPDIERCFGSLDYVVRRHGAEIDRLRGHGDPLGIHVHAGRWDEARSVSFSDYADTAWTTHCLTVAAETFAECFGEPARRSSQGGYFLTESILDAAVALGIQVDLTPEPGLGPKTEDPAFGAYATAPSGDFRKCPRQPYYPSRQSLDMPSSSFAECRPILLVPMTAYDYVSYFTPWPRRIVKGLLGWPRHHAPLNPWKTWSSPQVYWDLIERAADEQAARYIAFAIRTDLPGSSLAEEVGALLKYLPNHPISERLRFVDPLGPEILALATPSRNGAR